MCFRVSAAVSTILLCALPAAAARIVLRGKVVMEEGTLPSQGVTVERFCYGTGTNIVAHATNKGDYIYQADTDAMNWRSCVLRAALQGYESTSIGISHLNWWSDPNLPDIVVRKHDPAAARIDTTLTFADSDVPRNARQPWNNAVKAMQAGNWALAQRELRTVIKEAPKFNEGWSLLGDVCLRLNQPEEARSAFERALEIDPKLDAARISLARAYLDLKNWEKAASLTEAAVRDKLDKKFPELHAHRAVALFHLTDLNAAEASITEAIRLDTKRQLPRAELILASILESKPDYDGAKAHLLRFLELDPRAADAASIREHIENLGKTQPGSGSTALPELQPLETTTVSAAGEAWVPGGLRALARMAEVTAEPTYQNFFADYCRTIGAEASVGTSRGIPRYAERLRTFLATVMQLLPLGERDGEVTRIRINAGSKESRERAERVLQLLGWTLKEQDGAIRVEPGYRPQDALLQAGTDALGVDPIAMQEALEAGREFAFEIREENARMIGGDVWKEILVEDRIPPGGLAAVFASDGRIAKACAGLNTMDAASAAVLINAVGLRNLAARHAEVLYRYSEALVIASGRVAVPGGSQAEPVWQKLAGANPGDPAAFLRALIDKDQGRLAAFYFALRRADQAHQRYFTQSAARAERTYFWFRDSEEFHYGIVLHRPGWLTELLQSAPVNADSELAYGSPQLEALVPISRLEQKRGRPFDAASSALLVNNFSRWKALFPYFEAFPELGRGEFEALAAFATTTAKRAQAERNRVLGEWYAMVELIAQGVKAGSIDGAMAARAFRQTSELLSGEAAPARVAALLREILNGADPDDGVPAVLLKLDAARRAEFTRTLELLRAPTVAAALASSDPEEFAAALASLVYAASLKPGLLLLNEDPGLLRRHQYWTESLFAPASRQGQENGMGTHFRGSFVGFDEAVKGLMDGAKAAPLVAVKERPAPAEQQDADDSPEIDFRSDGRLVEIYTTVTDNRGRYIDNLTQAQFSMFEGDAAQEIIAFEPQTSGLSVALLLDTTGSMADTIASLKRAALRLIDTLRPEDAIAVYSFSDTVTEMVPFTTDRAAAKRAVMGTRAFGNTALYDAVTRVGHALTGRSGKKVVILFTDGKDTSSTLTAQAAIERSKAAGVPVYTIAEGEAATNPDLPRQLAVISNATGGVPFEVRDPDDMGKVFEKVSEDLAHGYLLYLQPHLTDEERGWRPIRVVVQGQRDLKVRAREGYYP